MGIDLMKIYNSSIFNLKNKFIALLGKLFGSVSVI